ncbi:hypothetical protein BH09PAT3_BH09PAT3_3620 [soil metagenome]
MVSTQLVQAATSTAKDISRSYNSLTELQPGSVVSTTKTDATTVEASNIDNANRLVGVVVPADTSLVAVDPDSSKAQVSSSGNVNVLVSTVNGAISKGDKIAVSPFSGIGMKSIDKGYVVGTALVGFNANSEGATDQKVIDKSGDSKDITVGYVQINLTPRFDSGADADAGLNSAQAFVKALTGHVVSTPRIIVSFVLATLTVVVISALMYAAIYGSIVSIGRNPLAKDSILRTLTRVLALALLIVAFAFGMIYLLLR